MIEKLKGLLRRKKYLLVDNETEELVMEFDRAISMRQVRMLIEAEEIDDGLYSLYEVSNGDRKKVWSMRKRKPKKEKEEEKKEFTKEEAIELLREKARKLKEDAEDLKRFQEQIKENFGITENIDMTVVESPYEGLKKGMGTALYRGLVKRDDEVTAKVLENLDGLSFMMKGLGAFLFKQAGVKMENRFREKVEESEDKKVVKIEEEENV